MHVDGGHRNRVHATVRIDTPAEASYYLHGGILPYILRQMLGADQYDKKVV